MGKTKSKSDKAAKGSRDKDPINDMENRLKANREIDDLFSVKKADKVDRESLEPAKKVKKVRAVQAEVEPDVGVYGIMKSNIRSSIISPEAPVHRICAESGLPVYKAALLKVGEGGGTPLCPFDCDCCF
ncbi:hypothetical protein B484DRAFT_455530 [Ochromonadaceae sp. CCMP2298]|nr:hypothetical protein B484DRAFT_455530 [Ochromonadaceae sp. CCMP2298]|mmetsp:Transcript_29230/g.64882  ORF Transcript_29230/g.64882 Transcript_29230/m.64882 type:complete len:129 (+) Transcript_29230:195-581(+)|eukprot:CAMPEP_0173201488 /NCGR_PEP_ID=MMETSP1141-20130122/18378_1 /TAXON_ID=483371 /ORGANISM="non described non described, Strain CCMP2298" /LENGTH=128 /DNA_ID=CAMNT_0014126613 /DNA_START=147 /DNA_END=533 /DNA_ORIENTATION=-